MGTNGVPSVFDGAELLQTWAEVDSILESI